MNKEDTKKCIEVMQAFVDGKTIQTADRVSTKWWDNDSPDWSFSTCQYRIKPEPKIIYVNEYQLGTHGFADAYEAENVNSRTQGVAVPYVRLSDVGLLK